MKASFQGAALAPSPSAAGPSGPKVPPFAAAYPDISTRAEARQLQARLAPKQQLQLTPTGSVRSEVDRQMFTSTQARLNHLRGSLEGARAKLHRARTAANMQGGKKVEIDRGR